MKTHRQFYSGLVLFCYLLPLLFFAGYSIRLMPPAKSWPILSFGLLTIAFFSFILFLFFVNWEKKLFDSLAGAGAPLNNQLSFFLEKENKVTSIESPLNYEGIEGNLNPVKDPNKQLNLLETALKESQEGQGQIKKEYEAVLEELKLALEQKELLLEKVKQSSQDFSDYKLFTEEQLRQKQIQLHSLQQVIEEQRGEMEKRQDHIFQLDTKVHDLSYEIKTLLYIHESEKEKTSTKAVFENFKPNFPSQEGNSVNEKFIRTPADGNALLKKCLEMAQKYTGATYHTSEAMRYREFTSSNFAIDQRRLYDSLRNEKEGLIFIYSQKEGKLIFSNQQSKVLLGWSPDHFISNFMQIIHEGQSEWKRGLGQLNAASESQFRLLARNKNGQEKMLSCHLGVVPSGLFRSQVIGVLYPI